MAAVSSSVVLETALGCIGIAWNERGLTRLLLPESRAAIERRLASLPGASSASPKLGGWIGGVIAGIRRYAEGEPVEFADAPVDLDGVDAFRLAVYAAARNFWPLAYSSGVVHYTDEAESQLWGIAVGMLAHAIRGT